MTEGSCRCLICNNETDDLDAVDTKLVADIESTGWGVLMIPEDDDSLGWAFTVGLRHSYGSPEVAMFGLDVETMWACLNTVGRHVRDGLSPADGMTFDDVLSDRPVQLRTVDRRWYRTFFGTALGFYWPPLDFLQLMWPDRRHTYPWEDGYAFAHPDAQPWLWVPPADHVDGPWRSQC